MKTVWLVGAGQEAVRGIQHARALGYRVIVTDGDPHAPGFNVADVHHVVDTYDIAANVKLAQDYWHGAPDDIPHGVLAMCSDVPYTVARIAEILGVRGLPPATARLGQDKLAMKRVLVDAGIPTAVAGWEVRSGDEIRDLMALYGSLVVKPVDSRGARGVTLCRDPHQADFSFLTAETLSPTGRVLAEEWLDGPQISTEGIMLPTGEFVTVGFFDRNYSRLEEFAPYFIEDGADGPTRLSAVDKLAVEDVFEQAARAIVGKTPCTVKGDMVLTPDGPAVIELALRLSGGYMSTKLIPWSTGVDFIGAAIKLAVGDPVTEADLLPVCQFGVAIRFTIPPGCTCHPERTAHAIGRGLTRDEAIWDAERYLPCR